MLIKKHLLIGSLGGKSNVAIDYYVSNSGSDSNAGTSRSAPFLTVAHALSVVGSAAGKTIGLNCGSVFRESGLAPTADGLKFVSYGSGLRPQILGSSVVSTTWTSVSETEYQTPLAYTPRTAFWLSVAGVVTKLRPGTSGSLALYQYAVSGGNLHVNIGFDPTGQRIEIAADNSNRGFQFTSVADITLEDIDVKFMPFTGVGFDSCSGRCVMLNCDISFNGDDGIALGGAQTNLALYGCAVQGNGYQAKGGGGGPGDGISNHLSGTLLVDGCLILDNDQTGIGNENDTFNTVRYSLLRNNYNNVFIYNSATVAAGEHNFYYNVFINTPTDNAPFSINGPANVGSLMFVNIHNNTIWDEGSSAFVVLSTIAGTVALRNNIISGGVYGIGDYNSTVPTDGVTDADYNLYTNNSAAYQPGFVPAGVGANELTNATAGYGSTIAGAQDFALTTGSLAKASGTNLGYTRDFVGNPVPFGAAPCRGALEREAA